MGIVCGGKYSDALRRAVGCAVGAGLAWDSVRITVFRSAEEYRSRLDIWINRPTPE